MTFIFTLRFDVNNYIDEADRFFANPAAFLQSRFNMNTSLHTLPTHFVFYDVLLPSIHNFLVTNEYYEVCLFLSCLFQCDASQFESLQRMSCFYLAIEMSYFVLIGLCVTFLIPVCSFFSYTSSFRKTHRNRSSSLLSCHLITEKIHSTSNYVEYNNDLI
jgi:hypothetical protein